jgi:hypothetical protein
MKSYINVHPDAPNPLSGEDIEHLMQSNEGGTNPHYYDVGDPGYDIMTGYGRPNAGKILERIQLPCYKVWHFKKGFIPNGIWTDEGEMSITVTNPIVSALPLPLPPSGTYSAKRYKVTLQIGHDIDGYIVIGGWKRDSASDLAPLTTILPGDGVDVTLESYNASSALLSGYVYEIFVVNGQETDTYWWPVLPDQQAFFSYTIYSKHPTASDTCLFSVNDITDNVINTSISLYPNPGNGKIEIRSDKFLNTCGISVFNGHGQLVLQETMSSQQKVLNIENIPSGLYLLRVENMEISQTFKYIKQ